MGWIQGRWGCSTDENLVGGEGRIIPVLLHILNISKKALYGQVTLLLAMSFIDGKFRCYELF